MKRRVKSSKIWTMPKEKLQNIINESSSFVEVLIKIGYDGYNGNHRTLKNRVQQENFDLTIMNINRKIKEIEHLNRIKKESSISLESILVSNSSYNRQSLKRRLIEEKIKEYKCECCGIGDMWNGLSLKLQLDHINGINNDNRIENLRFICPNCHSQSSTFSGKNRSNNVDNKCIDCGCGISKFGERCHSCSVKYRGKHQKLKFDINKELLEKIIYEKSFMEIGKMFNVCDNSIRKRCKKYGIKIPKFPRGHWLKK